MSGETVPERVNLEARNPGSLESRKGQGGARKRDWEVSLGDAAIGGEGWLLEFKRWEC